MCLCGSKSLYIINFKRIHYRFMSPTPPRPTIILKLHQPNLKSEIVNGDAAQITNYGLPVADYVLTSPPYWDMLRAKLFEAEVKRREDKAVIDQANKTDIAWGHQIRSYVLNPYQMVKDLRTGVSTSDSAGVLDGDLDPFMQAALAQKAFGGGPDSVEDVE